MLFKKINEGIANIANDTTTLISQGTELVGDITFTGNLEIIGSVIGNINSQHKDARVRILNGGSVQGDIRSASIEVNGSVKGNIYALQTLCLQPDCDIDGNIHYSQMEMRVGAQVNGSCVYQPSSEQKLLEGSSTGDDKVKDIRGNKQW
jgi:cytoskeletal protein CcmA (bactofilin family)